jgi:hypothetical protein
LLETKEDLVKPIFISLCMENSELCRWVFKEQLLNNSDITKLKNSQIRFMGELAMAQNTPDNFLEKINLIREYLFKQIREINEDEVTIETEEAQQNLNKLFKIYSKAVGQYQYKFPEATEPKTLSILDSEIELLLSYKAMRIPRPATDRKVNSGGGVESGPALPRPFGKGGRDSAESPDQRDANWKMRFKIQSSVMKFLMVYINPPKPFVKKEKNFPEKAIADKVLRRLMDFKVLDFWSLDIVTVMAANDPEIYSLVRQEGVIEKLKTILLGRLNLDHPSALEEHLVADHTKDVMTILSQSLFNLSREPTFLKENCRDLPLQLFNKAVKSKAEDSNLQLNDQLDKRAVEYLLETIKNLILCAPTTDDQNYSLEQISAQLKSDLSDPTKLKDISFVQMVIVPLLHAEVPVSVSLNLKNGDKIEPIVSQKLDDSSNKKAEKEYFLKTSLMNATMMETLSTKMVEMRQDIIPEVKTMAKTQWEKVYSETQPEGSNSSYWTDTSRFKEFVMSIEEKSHLFLIAKVANKQNGGTGSWPQSDDMVFGVYCHEEIKTGLTAGVDWGCQDFNMKGSPHNFAFFYNGDKEMVHFEQNNKGASFGYIYTDYSGGTIGILNEFMTIAWGPESGEHRIGHTEGLNCLENSKYNHGMSFRPHIKQLEVWHYKPKEGAKLKPEAVSIRQVLKTKPGYKPSNPLNYYHENFVFEIGENITLEQIHSEYLGGLNFELSSSHNQTKTTLVRDLRATSDIVQIMFQKPQSDVFEESPEVKSYKPSLPILKKFEETKGIFNLLNVAIAVVQSYVDEKQKNTWILWLNELKSFCELPQFFEFFSKDMENSSTIYKLIDSKLDIPLAESSNTKVRAELEKKYSTTVKYTYTIIEELFKESMSLDLIKKSLENGTLKKLVDRLGQLTGEKARQKRTDEITSPDQIVVEIKSKEEPPASQEDKKVPLCDAGHELLVVDVCPYEDTDFAYCNGCDKEIYPPFPSCRQCEAEYCEECMDKRKDKVGKPGEAKKQGKKGVGYTTGTGAAWNVSEYLASKESKS